MEYFNVFSNNENQLTIHFASCFKNVDRAVDEVLKFIKNSKISIVKFDLNLAVRECLNNAVIHGNRNKAELLVKLDIKINNGLLFIMIEDEGDGFNLDKIQKNYVDDLALGGRGLIIVNRLGFDISTNKKGNILYLNRKLK